MHRFISKGPFQVHAEITLDREQSHHLVRVLRLEEGESIGLLDGQGHLGVATVVLAHAKAARVRVEQLVIAESRPQIQLCFALPKGQALDFIFRRATELGVHSFQPLETRFSSSAKGWNEDRWSHVIAEVCKQCEALFFPSVLPPLSLERWLEKRDPSRTLVVCDEGQRENSVTDLKAPLDLVVGAEGGFDSKEIESVRAAAAKFLGLGPNRLRAETACLVAIVLAKKEIREI